MTRTAISPRFATRTRVNIGSASDDRRAADGLELEEQGAELDRLAVVDVDRSHAAVDIGLELVEQLHRLEHAQDLPGRDDVADLDERRRSGLRRAVEDADHR